MAQRFPFLRLPLELRDRIYSHYFDPASRLVVRRGGGERYQFEFAIYATCRQLHFEAKRVFLRENLLVRVETPWPGAEDHVAKEGCVPIVASGGETAATLSSKTSFVVSVTAHGTLRPSPGICQMFILLDDLHLFTRLWHYATLDYPDLNTHLRLCLRMEDFPDRRLALGEALQQKFLMPFACVKELDDVVIEGFDPSVEKKLREEMAVPYDTREECIKKCIDFTDDGEKAMHEKKYQEALDLYMKAFHAIHILCEGYKRFVMADAFFDVTITSGPYEDWEGPMVRLVLRLRLAANVINAYLKLEDWPSAKFWGGRSVGVLEHFGAGLGYTDDVGANDIGLIYLRTAIAMRRMKVEHLTEGPGCVNRNCHYLVAKACCCLDPKVVARESDANGVAWEEGVVRERSDAEVDE